jgi:hypothetical protein
MNAYVWCKYLLCIKILKFNFKIKFKEILKYEFVKIVSSIYVIYYFFVIKC